MIGIIKNKRSQIGSTLTWFAAVIVVVFIMIIFVVGVTGIAKIKGLPANQQGSSSPLGFSYSEEQVLNEKFISFLNWPTNSFGTMYDLLSKAEIKDGYTDLRKTVFIEEVQKFLETNFPAVIYDSRITLNSAKYGNSIGDYSVGRISINSGKLGSESILFSDDVISISVLIIPDKKITLQVAKRK